MIEGRVTSDTGIRFLDVVNGASEEIPPCAAMEFIGLASDNTPIVNKPSFSGQTANIVFNGPSAIPVSVRDGTSMTTVAGRGVAYVGFPAVALCSSDDGTPANGEKWGTEGGQWYLRKNHDGFTIVGNAREEDIGNLALVTSSGGDDETAFITVTSTATVDSRYPAVRRIQDQLLPTWGNSEQCWAYNVRGAMYAGVTYLARWNNTLFAGRKQGDTVDCCAAPSSTACGCAIPALMCVVFDSTATCLDNIKATVRNGLSDTFFACCGGSLRIYLLCLSSQWTAGIIATFVTVVGVPPSDPCPSQCRLNITSVVVDCGPPFVATISGTLEDATAFSPCADAGTAFTATMTSITDEYTECVSSGSDTPPCIYLPGGDPQLVPAQIVGTWAKVSGTCTPDPDGQENTLSFSHRTGSEYYWTASGPFMSGRFYITAVYDTNTATWTELLLKVDTDGDGDTDVSANGTLTETSPGTWTFLWNDVNVGGSCVVDFAASFDEADCV